MAAVWTYTKTDWSPADRMTYDQANRIGSNINYLTGSETVRTNYTQNDIMTAAEWALMKSSLQSLCYATALQWDLPGDETTADNINYLESLIQRLYDRIETIFSNAVANIYAGDDLYAAAAGQYPGVAENYSRGL